MKVAFCLVAAIALWHAAECLTYRKEGDFMVGAIIPLTKGDDCKSIDAAGVALAEAIVYGVDQVTSESDFTAFPEQETIGYDIRDNCGDDDTTRKHAHAIAGEALAYKDNKAAKKPDDVVISEFTNDDISSLSALDGEEILAAVSYSPDNARLQKTAQNQYKISKLVSVYPEESKKISAVANFIKEFKFQHVFAVGMDNVEGKESMAALADTLDDSSICTTEVLVSGTDDVDDILAAFAAKRLVDVVVIDVPEDLELELYKQVDSQNLTDMTFITFNKYIGDVSALESVRDVVQGGFSVYYKKESKNFRNYMMQRTVPYSGRLWLRALFTDLGGNVSCLTTAGSGAAQCVATKDKVKDALVANALDAEFAYHAVLAIAYGYQKALAKNDTDSLLTYMAGLNVNIAALSSDPLVFSDELSAVRSKFFIENLKIVNKDLQAKWVGAWDGNSQMGGPLSLTKTSIAWSVGTAGAPESVCSATCAAGSSRQFLDGEGKCCWTCAKCPNGTQSNILNADTCESCPAGTVVEPDQSGCKEYKLMYFEWFGGPGAVVIILMVIGVALVLFGLGVFSQNSSHELVVAANYNSLCLFLLAILILIFAPIPLLIKIPSIGSCVGYIIMFNVGISIVLGVVMSRSAWVNNMFENGELAKGTLGKFPRTTVILIVVILQIIISIIAFEMEQLQTMHNLTDQWDQRYHECSSWASTTFWAGFTFNIIISVIGNSMSCSSTQMADNAYELKYILLVHLMFYMFGIVELVIFFRCNDEHLAGGQAINCILFAYAFFFCYAWPKIYNILFCSKGGKLIPSEPEDEEEGGITTDATIVSSSAGFTGHGIVGIKVREEEA